MIAIAIIALGVSELGTPTSSARTSKEVVTAESGVVQTTVSGSGNVEPAVDQAVNFATSGTLQTLDVKVGQRVKKGQLIATLDPSAADLSLSQAQDSLTAAEDQLTSAEEGGTSSSGSGNSGSGSSGSGAQASAASVNTELRARDFGTTTGTTTTPTTTTPTGTTTSTTPTSTGTTTTPTTTPTTRPTRTATVTVTVTTTTKTGAGHGSSGSSGTGATGGTGGSTTTAASTPHGTSTTENSSATRTTAATTTTTKSAPSPAAIAQAEASVDSAQSNVTSAEKTLSETKLYAPVTGTIASLAGDQIGATVSSGGSAANSNSSAGSSALSSASSNSSSSSSSGFATIINSKAMTMTVSLSESDISSVKVGQLATISLTALSGVELGAHVTSISPLGTSSSGVVSYDVTLTTDQNNSKVLPGMSATATIVISQAQGVTVPNQAITGAGSDGTVELDSNGKITSQSVVVGLRGSSRSVILSGLKSGQQVQITIALPALGTTSTTSSSSSTSGFGGGGFGGRFGGAGGFTGGGAGARAFFGGGGGG